METLSPWDEMLSTTGRIAEDVGRTLSGRERESKRTWTIDELMNLSNSLKNCAIVLDQRIDSLLKENQ